MNVYLIYRHFLDVMMTVIVGVTNEKETSIEILRSSYVLTIVVNPIIFLQAVTMILNIVHRGLW